MGCHSISDVTEHAKITLDLKIETELGDEEFEVRGATSNLGQTLDD